MISTLPPLLVKVGSRSWADALRGLPAPDSTEAESLALARDAATFALKMGELVDGACAGARGLLAEGMEAGRARGMFANLAEALDEWVSFLEDAHRLAAHLRHLPEAAALLGRLEERLRGDRERRDRARACADWLARPAPPPDVEALREASARVARGEGLSAEEFRRVLVGDD